MIIVNLQRKTDPYNISCESQFHELYDGDDDVIIIIILMKSYNLSTRNCYSKGIFVKSDNQLAISQKPFIIDCHDSNNLTLPHSTSLLHSQKPLLFVSIFQ